MSQPISRHTIRLSASIIAGAFILFSFCIKAEDDISKEQLDSVRTQITDQSKDLRQARKRLDKLQKQLKADDVAIAGLSKEIRSSTSSITALTQEHDALELQKQQLLERQQTQQALLQKQIQAAYRLGSGNHLKMLLNDPHSAPLDRMLSYYHYLNHARVESMSALTETVQRLEVNRRALNDKVEDLSQHKAGLLKQQQSLENRRDKRTATIKQSNLLLADHRLALEQLKTAETYLAGQLKKQAERQLQLEQQQQITLTGLKTHSLDWPVKGRIIHSFGSSRVGQSRWNGIVIQAQRATPVKAVADGKVVFADWMRGYGLVIAIDHGKDYFTLYGYNQEVNKKQGDIVKRGDIIASVGASGGQTTPSLYFQIRHKDKAQDPQLWKK